MFFCFKPDILFPFVLHLTYILHRDLLDLFFDYFLMKDYLMLSSIFLIPNVLKCQDSSSSHGFVLLLYILRRFGRCSLTVSWLISPLMEMIMWYLTMLMFHWWWYLYQNHWFFLLNIYTTYLLPTPSHIWHPNLIYRQISQERLTLINQNMDIYRKVQTFLMTIWQYSEKWDLITIYLQDNISNLIDS